MGHIPAYSNAKFVIRSVNLDLGISFKLPGEFTPEGVLGTYFLKTVSNIFLPNIIFETKEVHNTETPEIIPVAVKYSDLIIDIDLLEFKPSLIETLQPLDFEIVLFQTGVSNAIPGGGSDPEIVFKIYGCHLKEHYVGDFSHAENRIKKIRLAYQPSYMKLKTPDITDLLDISSLIP